MQTPRPDRLARTALVVAVLVTPLLMAAQQPAAKPPAGTKSAPAAKAPAAKAPATKAAPATPSPGAGPIVVVDTVKGSFEFETYPEDAPKSVDHILKLAQKNFYNGQRVHRVEPGFVVQFGDSRTRDMTKRDQWGRADGGGSGATVGVAEISKKRLHVRGAVGMAHAGDPAGADSQIYILLGDKPALNGRYAIIGQVISGMDVVDKLQVTDVVKRVTVKAPAGSK